jgi:hypothetical protein
MFKKVLLYFTLCIVQLSFGMKQPSREKTSLTVNQNTLHAVASNKTCAVRTALLSEKKALDALYSNVPSKQSADFKLAHIDRLQDLFETNIPFYSAQSKLIKNSLESSESIMKKGMVGFALTAICTVGLALDTSVYTQIPLSLIGIVSGIFATQQFMMGSVKGYEGYKKAWQEENEGVQKVLQEFGAQLKQEVEKLKDKQVETKHSQKSN